MSKDSKPIFNKVKSNLIVDAIMFLLILSIFSIKGKLHETLAYTLGALVIAHIIMHWQQIKVMFRQLIPGTISRKIATILFLLATLALLLIPSYYPAAHGPIRGEFRGGPSYSTHGNRP